MLFQCFLLLFVSNWLAIEAMPQRDRFPIIPTPKLIETEGYPAETHEVTTEDGYILQMHRIPYGRNGENNEVRPPVFLMHGLLAASSSFVAIGADDSLAFNLADAGFDVWMGNARGNRDSRRHVNLDPNGEVDKFKFWDFSWEDIGFFDIPAMTDYVRENTRFEKIHYIGHSQGGTVFFVMNALRPEYNDRFASAQLLAPAGFKNYFSHPVLSAAALFTDTIHQAAINRGLVEIGVNVLDLVNNEELTDIWDYIIKEILDAETGDNIFTFPSVFGGGALKQIAHYGQNIRSGNFQRWDFGLRGNREVYGTLRPPRFDMSKITVKATLHYTIADNLVAYQDVEDMTRVLPNAVSRRIAKDEFSHVGFIFDREVRELVTDYIIKDLKAVELN